MVCTREGCTLQTLSTRYVCMYKQTYIYIYLGRDLRTHEARLKAKALVSPSLWPKYSLYLSSNSSASFVEGRGRQGNIYFLYGEHFLPTVR